MQGAPAIIGTDLDGSPVELTAAAGRTVLYFLTSSCKACVQVWKDLGEGREGTAVTPDRATESGRKLEKLAGGVPVIMSSEAWFEFGVGPAPWRVVIEDGVVQSSGPVLGL